MKRTLLPAILILTAAASAQTQIATCPPACATRDGNSLYSIFSSNSQIRFFQIVGTSDHGLKPGSKIIKVSVRRDANDTTQFAARSAPYEVYMSNSQRAGMMATTNLMANHGQPRMLVMKQRTINFPLSPKPATTPAPWGPDFPLDVPFPVLAMNSICVEFVAMASSNTFSSWHVDREWPTATGPGSSPVIGTSCGNAGTLEVDTGTLFPGANLWFRVSNITQSSSNGLPCLAAVGTSKTAWGPIPLPLNLTAMGATGCAVYVGPWLATMPGKVVVPAPTAYNNIDIFFPLPMDNNLLGATFYGQVVIANPAANPFGAEFTNGEEIRMATQMPAINMSYAYSYSLTATTGYSYLNRGMVLGLHWQ